MDPEWNKNLPPPTPSEKAYAELVTTRITYSVALGLIAALYTPANEENLLKARERLIAAENAYIETKK